MSFRKNDNQKEYVCRQCTLFIDPNELKAGCCPQCGNDDTVFTNDLDEEEQL